MVTQAMLGLAFVALLSFGAPVTAKAQITVTALGEDYNECGCRYRHHRWHHRDYGYRDGYRDRGYGYRRGYGRNYDAVYEDGYAYDEYEAYRRRVFDRWVAREFYFYKDLGDSPQFRNYERAYNIR